MKCVKSKLFFDDIQVIEGEIYDVIELSWAKNGGVSIIKSDGIRTYYLYMSSGEIEYHMMSLQEDRDIKLEELLK